MTTDDIQNSVKSPQRPESNLGKLGFAVLVMFVVMVWSAYHTGPSGQTFGIKGFILFWFRELIILALAILAVVVGGFNWLKQRHQRRKDDNHAP